MLPKWLTRVRHYGYLASEGAKSRLRVRALLGRIGEPAPVLPALSTPSRVYRKALIGISKPT